MLVEYDTARDAQSVAALWAQTLGTMWPMSPANLATILACPLPTQRPMHLVEREGERVIGFVGTQFNQHSVTGSRSGNIMVVMVTPDFQRQGIGRRLLNAGLDRLREAGASWVQIGGWYPRIWPGVPTNLPQALKFFRACGWDFENGLMYDLVRNLGEYTLADEFRERMARERIVIEPATEADASQVLALQEKEFPYWLDAYKYLAHVGDYGDMLVARDPDLGILGSLNMYGPWSHPSRADAPFQTILGNKIGGLGEVGVSASARGRGIGIALVAFGAQILKDRGVGNAFIGWTTLADFYGKLGYAVWKDYYMARRSFTST